MHPRIRRRVGLFAAIWVAVVAVTAAFVVTQPASAATVPTWPTKTGTHGDRHHLGRGTLRRWHEAVLLHR